MILLNLTIPPLVYILLGPAVFSNLSLPVQPSSAVAAFWPNGTSIPCWVLQDRLYVLQDNLPAYVEYVPQFSNRSGVYSLTVNASDGLMLVIPPGILADIYPTNYTLININKTGLYVYIKSKYVSISFLPISIVFTTTTTALKSTTPLTTNNTTAPSTTSVTNASNPLGYVAIVVAVVILIALASLLSLRRRDTCGDLGDTDRLILRELESRGGKAPRSELARSLGLPPSTLHKHLHKLSRYGYVRLVSEGGTQKVELVRRCSDG
ncbi:MAG: winged helix-turn-helix transcriptional regulator [Thermoproteus sp.]